MDDEIDREELLQKLAFELSHLDYETMPLRMKVMADLLHKNGYLTKTNSRHYPGKDEWDFYYVLARKDKLE